MNWLSLPIRVISADEFSSGELSEERVVGKVDVEVDQPLQRPVHFLPGVSREDAQLLAKLGIRRIFHLLFHFPRDYQVVDQAIDIGDLEEGATVAVIGTVEEIDSYQTKAGQVISGLLIRQDSHFLRAVWFNQGFVRSRYQIGQRVRATGKVRFRGFRWEMVHPQVIPLDPAETSTAAQVVPVYPLTAGVKQAFLRRVIQRAVSRYANALEEMLPEAVRVRHGLLGIVDAVRNLHAPPTEEARDAALRRFRYQELLLFQLALSWQTAQRRQTSRAPALPLDARINARIRRLLPFELTSEQDRVVAEIAADMAQETPMQRLLQGDVGCGKTLVAAFAMLIAIAHNYQAALMAPTEILAQQHFETFGRLLSQSRVRMGLLAGSMTARERQERLAAVASGELDLVVGTHTLAGEEIQFCRPGLVVVDEQHKFGVRQRAELHGDEQSPHYLTMSATPIPRTLARTLYGDLHVSTINELPPGRQPVHTYVAAAAERDKWWQFFTRKLQEGRQGIVVSPYIEQGDHEDRLAAEQLWESLANGVLEAFRLEAIHGRLSAAERVAAMDRFRSGETQVLIATSLIEVGIDVPNAAVMTIEHADRFGLAQLHQLRGRVGRGAFPGYVCLFTASEDPRVQERLEQFAQTTNGFEVAELDLRHRGPGELLGTKQHGANLFRVADFVRDSELLDLARQDAQAALLADPTLEQPEWQALRRALQRRFASALTLSDAG